MKKNYVSVISNLLSLSSVSFCSFFVCVDQLQVIIIRV